jgi:glycosyltransferase involved in cell wall biosynthesis
LQDFEQVADEIVIVDTGSTDDTKKVIQDHYTLIAGKPCTLVEHEWHDDFSEARNAALDLATKPWIFWADADDSMSVASAANFNNMKRQLSPDTFYMLPVINMGVNNTPSGQFAQTRIFPRTPEIRFKHRVHENINEAVMGLKLKTIVLMGVKIEHWGYSLGKEEMQAKVDRNYRLLCMEPERIDFHYYAGNYYNQKENSWYAMAHYLQAIEENKGSASMIEKCKTYVGTQLEKLKLYEAAIEWYGNSEDSDAVFRKAECHHKLNDILNAKISYEEYVKMENHISLVGDMRMVQQKIATKRLVEITTKELKYWQEFNGK